MNLTTNEKSTPSSSPTSTPSSGSSITTLRDVLSDILKPATPQRSKGGKRKQLVGIGQSLTSDEALKILQEVEKEKEREERKKEREEKKKEKAGRKRKQEVVSTKPKRIKTITETKTNRCVLCEAIWMKMIQTTQRSGLNVMFVAHGHMAPVLAIHQTITSMKRHLFVVNLYLWATDIYSYSKHSTHPKEL